MPYPFWDAGVPYGVLMAAIAVLHVVVSHFAIGGGLYLVVAEGAARRVSDLDRLAFVRRLSRTFILLTLVFGALTGVGIWFVIGLLSPNATEALIRVFVWGWAIEWTFFLVEILAAILYGYGWDRLSARGHLTLGWIYFVAAFLSLVVINGIVTFMLTPGAWLETGSFGDALLNPTYGPSLVLRTGVCLVMAGLFALVVASRYPPGALRERLVRSHAGWALAGLVLAAIGGAWYRGALPAELLAIATQRLSIAATALDAFVLLTGVLLLAVLGLGLAAPRALGRASALLLLVLGVAWLGAFEWAREATRKPYAVYGWMYGNGQRVADEAALRKDGLLAHVAFRTGDDGADLWRYACATCHTLEGYNPVRPAFDGTDRTYVLGAILNLHEMRGKMPPFLGSASEAGALATWLWARVDQRPLEQVYDPARPDLGAKVYEARCARCHEIGGFGDKRRNLQDYTAEDLTDLLTDPEGIEGMPVFSGSKEQLDALLQHLRPHCKKEAP